MSEPSEVADYSALTPDEKVDLMLAMSTQLTGDVRRLNNSRRWSRVAMGALSLTMAMVLGLLIASFFTVRYSTDQANRTQQRFECVVGYLNQYAAVAFVRSDANARRTDAIDEVFAALPPPGSNKKFDEEAFARAQAAELKASDDYQRTIAANPLPPPPTVAC